MYLLSLWNGGIGGPFAGGARAGRLRGALLLAGLVGLVGCGIDGRAEVSGSGASARLQALGGERLGLRYSGSGTLSVRRLSAAGQPDAGVAVTFTLFGDSRGTSLAGGVGLTDGQGVAAVTVTAGFADASFRVVASSPGAEDLTFSVVVSGYPFARVTALLSYPGASAGKSLMLRALVFAQRPCAQLPPVKAEPTPLAQKVAAASTTSAALIDFPDLPASDYAIVGRAEDDAGRLVARGCVDVLASQLSGDGIQVPVPLSPVVALLGDAYRAQGELTLSFGPQPSPAEPWVLLARCPAGIAQFVLDALTDSLGPGPLANRIVAHRGRTDDAGCRPAAYLGNPSLDQQLQALLAAKSALALQLPDVTADLVAAMARVGIGSRLALTRSSGSGAYLASHALTSLTLAGVGGAHPATYDAASLALPVPSAEGVAASFDGQVLSIDEQRYTLRLPALWERALADVALRPRGLSTDVRALVAALIDPASSVAGNRVLKGCAAVEELVCGVAGVVGPCPMAPACESAKDGVAARLRAPFAPTTGIDLTLRGRAIGLDLDGDLLVDQLADGTYSADLWASPSWLLTGVEGTFSAALIPLQ